MQDTRAIELVTMLASSRAIETSMELAENEQLLLKACDQLVDHVIRSKVDFGVSQLDAGLESNSINQQLNDKYLSSDPAFAMEMGMGFGYENTLGHFHSEWHPHTGYQFFSFDELVGIELEEEMGFDEDFRDQVQSQRSRARSLFYRNARSRQPAPKRQASSAPVATDVSPGMYETEAATLRAYPKRMGRTGSTLLTRPQRTVSRMLSTRRNERAHAVNRLANTLVRNEALMGPPTTSKHTEGAASTWAPHWMDAALTDEFPIVPSSTPWNAVAPQDAVSTAPMTASTDPSRQAAIRRGGRVRPFGSQQATALPALGSAVTIASAAFGAAPGSNALGFGAPSGASAHQMLGIFSPERTERALQITTLGMGVSEEETADFANYRELIYDAAEHTWIRPELSMNEAGLQNFDATAQSASPSRNGRTVSNQQATVQLIARAIANSPQRTRDSLSKQTGSPGSVFDGISAQTALPSNESTQAAPLGVGVAAPAALSQVQSIPAGPATPAAFRSQNLVNSLALHAAMAASAISEPTRVRTSDVAGAMAGLDLPVVAAVSDLQGQDPTELARGIAQSVHREGAGSTFLGREPRSSARFESRSNFAANPAKLAPPTIAQALTGRPSALEILIPGHARQDAPSVGPTSGLFTRSLQPGNNRMQVTATGPELFAARHLTETQHHGILTQPMQAPVTVAGEVRYGYGSLAGPMDDPVIYLDLAEQSQQGHSGLRIDPAPGLTRAPQMSTTVAAGLRAVTMPLSSAETLRQAMHSSRQPSDGTMRTEALPSAPAQWTSAPTFGSLRTEDGLVQRLTHPLASQTTADMTTDAVGMRTAVDTAVGTIAPRAFDTGWATTLETENIPAFYNFSYDVETALLRGDLETATAAAGLSGQHVEVRNGQIVRAVPATQAAQRTVQARPTARTAATRSHTTLGGISQSGRTQRHAQHLNALNEQGIQPAAPASMVVGASPLERGFPALALSTTPGLTDRVATPPSVPTVQGVVAASKESEFSMLPPMVRSLLHRQTEQSIRMTENGSDTAGLLARLAAVADSGSAHGRSAILHQLAVLGVDTPELLRILEEPTGSRGETPRDALSASSSPRDLLQRDSSTGASKPAEFAAAAAAGQHTQKQLQKVLTTLTGNAQMGASETSVESDQYFGDFAPARMIRTGAADLLRGLLAKQGPGPGTARRPNALAFGAEQSEFVALTDTHAATPGKSTLGQALMTSRRLTATGAPTRGAQLHAKAQRLEQRQRSLTQRKQDVSGTLPLQETVQSGVPGTSAIQAEQLADRLAMSIADSLRTGQTSTATLPEHATHFGGMGWDGEVMPLMATSEEAGFADRVAGAAAPWEATARSDKPGRTQSQNTIGDTLSTALGMDAHRMGTTDRGDRGLGRGIRLRGADGMRGFTAIAPDAIRSVLGNLPSSRNIAQFLGGGLDLTYAVLDRANGAFAGLDAGILRFLQDSQGPSEAGSGAGQGREIFPGMDDWPAETMEILASAGWGPGSDDSDTGARVQRAEQRIHRLERRLGAAQEAYSRQSHSRAKAGMTPASMDSVDWSLINTSGGREAPASADLGRLASTMVRPSAVAPAEMAMVAPAVKAVAQHAQLKPTSEPVGGGGGATDARTRAAAGAGKKKKKIDYEGLAGEIARRLSNHFRLERDRIGKI